MITKYSTRKQRKGQLYWVKRTEGMTQKSWKELSKQEKIWQREAQKRAEYIDLFGTYE